MLIYFWTRYNFLDASSSITLWGKYNPGNIHISKLSEELKVLKNALPFCIGTPILPNSKYFTINVCLIQ